LFEKQTNFPQPAVDMNRPKTADPSLMRELNASIIMDCIRLKAPLSRADLAGYTGLTRSTVSLIVNDLINSGFVQESTTRQDPKVGRPGLLIEFNPKGGFVVGVEIGVDFISVILTDFTSQILWRYQEQTSEQETQSVILERAEELVARAVAIGMQLGMRPLGIGVGIPGLVDVRHGKVMYAPNLCWYDFSLRQRWTERFNLPIFVENEANCACLGEHFYGVAHDVKDFIFLKTGVGLGGGVLLDSKLFRGASGFAGEVGHMTLYSHGPLCRCGRVGCWETFVRPTKLVSDITERLQKGEPSLLPALVNGDLTKITLNELAEAAKSQDALTLHALEVLGNHFAVGIANLVNVFNPELVVLGGSLLPVIPWLIPIIRTSLETNVLQPLRGITRIETSSQGEDACLLGATALVIREILSEPLNGL
jgi:predicted NBD/HSP70 family sugar kinase